MNLYFFPYAVLASTWTVKRASSGRKTDLDVCRDIMDTIYKERPDFWPYGLTVAGHDSGLYLIKDSSDRAVGFTGWQVREREGRRVGYYTIGILPEFRGSKMAKAALAQLIRMKRATVDSVRACIVPHNTGSLRLAKSLGVPVDLLS